MMTDSEREDFYKQIPPLMHHFPHIFVLQQRMSQQAQLHGQATISQEEKAKEIEALKQSGILNLMSSPEGRARIQNFAAKVQNSRESAALEVETWDDEKQLEYFNSFLDHPVLQALQKDDPLSKINALIDLSEGDLQSAMKAILLLSKEGNSELIAKLKNNNSEDPQRDEVMRSLQLTLGSLANLKPRQPSQQAAHGHNHSHNHEHGSCSSSSGWDPLKPDVSRSSGNKMER
jgi:hypothetical protein